MKRPLLSVALLLLGCAVWGEWLVHPAVGVEYWIPDEWPREQREEVTVLRSPDRAVTVEYMVVHASEVDPAMKMFDAEISRVLRDVEIVRHPEVSIVNGMEVVTARGKGLLRQEPADCLVAIVFHREMALMVMGYAARELLPPHLDAIAMMMHEIRPVGGERGERQEWFRHPEMRIEYWLPPPWPRMDAEDGLEIRSPDGAVRLRYRFIRETGVDAAIEVFKKEIAAVLEGVEIVEHPSVDIINGLEVVHARGRGEFRGEQAAWMVAIAFHERMALMAYGFALRELFEEHRPALERMLGEIRPLER